MAAMAAMEVMVAMEAVDLDTEEGMEDIAAVMEAMAMVNVAAKCKWETRLSVQPSPTCLFPPE